VLCALGQLVGGAIQITVVNVIVREGWFNISWVRERVLLVTVVLVTVGWSLAAGSGCFETG